MIEKNFWNSRLKAKNLWTFWDHYVEQFIQKVKRQYNCWILLDMRNLHEQVKKAFCYQKLFWPFTVWINCSCDLKFFENSQPSALNFKSFSGSLEQFFLPVGQNNFGNKIPFLQSYGIQTNLDLRQMLVTPIFLKSRFFLLQTREEIPNDL